MSTGEWDEKYRQSHFNDSGPVPLVVQTCRERKPGRALDLACGAGRNALWLAAQGWQVTAVDSSPAAIELLEQRAQLTAARISTRVADLETRDFTPGDACWDLILVSYYLQRDLMAAIAAGLAPAGVAIVIVHLAQPDRPSRFSLQPGELASYFSSPDCTVLHYHEGPPTGLDVGRPVAEIVIFRK